MTEILAHTMRRAALCSTMALAALAGGCANDGGGNFFSNGFSTGALNDSVKPVAAKPAVDPVCVSMASNIEKLRQDGTVDRLEKAADGKTSDVKVKRASLVTQAQLNKANSDFIAKCGPNLPKSTVAAAAPVAAPAAAPVAAAAKPAAAKVAQAAVKAAAPAADNGVTVVPPAAAATAVAAAPKQ